MESDVVHQATVREVHGVSLHRQQHKQTSRWIDVAQHKGIRRMYPTKRH
jgi:hypothetical protein